MKAQRPHTKPQHRALSSGPWILHFEHPPHPVTPVHTRMCLRTMTLDPATAEKTLSAKGRKHLHVG